jgi:hypothetical protein
VKNAHGGAKTNQTDRDAQHELTMVALSP